MSEDKSFISPHIRGFDNQLEKIANLLIIVKEYQRYSDLMDKGQRWIDNGLRVCSKVIGVPKDFRERGMALENELGRIINSIGLNYCLQVPIGNYQIADHFTYTRTYWNGVLNIGKNLNTSTLL